MDWNTLFQTHNIDYFFCDVGARGGLEEPWISYQSFLKSLAFEPDMEEYKKLLKAKKFYQVYNWGLSDKAETAELKLTKSRGATSLLTPNQEYLNLFPRSDRWEVEKTVPIQCDALDSIAQKESVPKLDFIKVDTQGSELTILKGAKDTLSEVCGIQIEVEFHELYRGQALFADVDQFARNDLGLSLQDIHSHYWKYKTQNETANQKGSLVFGDALYFRNLANLDTWLESLAPEARSAKITKLVFTSFLYGYLDYSFKVLENAYVQEVLDKSLRDQLLLVLKKVNRAYFSFLPEKLRSALGHQVFKLSQSLRPTHEGWGTHGEDLGTK